jgi:hypothetical protein
MKNLLFIFAVAALVCGCAAQKTNPASAGPEVTIVAPLTQVRAETVAVIVNAGYTLTRSDEFVIEGRKDAGLARSALTVTAANPTAYKVVRANLIVNEDNVCVRLHSFQTSGSRDDDAIVERSLLSQIKSRCEAK